MAAGDPRGELIALQIEIAKLPFAHPRRIELEEHELLLFDRHWRTLTRIAGDDDKLVYTDVEYARGLIEHIELDRVRWKSIRRLTDAVGAPPKMTRLQLDMLSFTDEHVAKLARWPGARQLRVLLFHGSGLTIEAAKMLIDRARFPSLAMVRWPSGHRDVRALFEERFGAGLVLRPRRRDSIFS